jgi:DNA-binding response OmpR family regulator
MDKTKKKIVLVEDEETIGNLIVLRLEKSGYEVLWAKDGKRGLELIVEQKPDLVLLDIVLPGLGGFDILDSLKRDNILPDLSVVIISNSGQPVEIERAKRLGIRDYLVKVNFSPEEVLEKVQSVLSSPKETIEKTGEDNVLIIEDDTVLADSLERKFQEKKLRVFKAANASQARNILQGEHIDMILLDIILPDVDGFRFLEELKTGVSTKNIPVVIVSNLGQKEEIEKGKRLGAVDYLVKSDTVPGEIFEKVETILQKNKESK